MTAIEFLAQVVLQPFLAALTLPGLLDWLLMTMLAGLVMALVVMLWERPF